METIITTPSYEEKIEFLQRMLDMDEDNAYIIRDILEDLFRLKELEY